MRPSVESNYSLEATARRARRANKIREVIPERDRKIADIEEIARGEQKTALRPDPKNRHCADNTKRPLKEFVPTGSWSGSRTSKKRGCSVARHRHDATLTVRF